MTSPFDLPRHSGFSHSPYSRATPKFARAPIHNPYDKFTQPEFDAWIGGITGTLRRALGHEDEVESQPPSRLAQDDTFFSDDDEVKRLIEEEESVDADFEDTFAELPTRRAGKGKARDPRDGPGFGKGDENEPIVIGSEEEEDEEAEEEDEAHVEEFELDEGGSEEWERGSQSQEERDEDWGKGESSAQARLRHNKRQADVDDDDEEEYGEEYDEEAGQSCQEEENEYNALSSTKASSPVMVLSSDEEEGEADDGAPPVYELDEEYSGEEYSDDPEAGSSMLITKSYPATTHPPRYRAREEYQHQASSPAAEDLGDAEEVDEIAEDDQDVQLLAVVTSFTPPTVSPNVSAIEHHVEIRDPFSGSNTYAEDHHSGGDIRGRSDDFTADSLGPRNEGEAFTERAAHPQEKEIIDVDDVDDRNPEEVQPVFEDTSFPPRDMMDESIPSDRPIEIPDQWEGPKTFAEDYYSGGDVPSPDGPFNAHRLGANDEITTPTPEAFKSLVESEFPGGAEAVKTPDLVQQPTAEESTLLPNVVTPGVWQIDYPVELTERRDGSTSHAQGHHVGGDVRPGRADAQSAYPLRAGDDAVAPIIVDSIDDSDDRPVETTKVAPEAVPEPRVEFEHAGEYRGDSQTADTQGGIVGLEEDIAHATSNATRSPIHSTTFQTTESDFQGLYDDMAAAAFGESDDIQDQPVHLSSVDWDYAFALLNGLPTADKEQPAAHEVAAGGVTMADQVDSQGELTETVEEPSRDVEGAETVLIIVEPSVETVDDAAERTVASLVPAPAEDATAVDTSSDAPYVDQPQTPPALSNSLHHHEFGLPTPPSERTKDVNLPAISEQEYSCGASKGIDSDIMILEPDDSLAKSVNIENADVPMISEVEEFKVSDGAEADAHGEVDFDADVVQEPQALIEAEDGPTQSTVVVHSSLDVALDGRATTLVEGLPGGTSMQKNDRTQPVSELVGSAKSDFSTSTPVASDKVSRVEETIAANGDAAPTSSTDVDVFSSQNGIPTPVIANPAVPDPTSQPHTPSPHPPVLSLPRSPSTTLTSAWTPGMELPTPLSVPLQTSVLKALRMQQSQPVGSSDGLFTPAPAVDSGPATPGLATVQTANVAEPEVAERSARSSLEYATIDERPGEPFHSLYSATALRTTEEVHNTLQDLVDVEDTTTGSAAAHMEQTQPPELELSSHTLGPPTLRRPPSGPYSLRVVMRKATDPVLFSDPYPASLSTPENVISYLGKDVQDEECEEDYSQDNSISSVSTVDKEMEEKPEDTTLDGSKVDEDIRVMESMELRYPSLQPEAHEAVSTGIVLEEHPPGVEDLHEADADGDLDPDFVENANKAREPTPSPAPRQEDVETFEPAHSITPAVQAVEHGKDKQELVEPQDSHPALVERADGVPVMPVMSASGSNSEDGLPSILIIKKPAVAGGRRKDMDDGSDMVTDLDEPPRNPAKPTNSRSTKRKRSSSIQATSPLTRSMSSKQSEKRKVSSRAAARPRGSEVKKTSNKAYLGKDKGKGKEVHETLAHAGSFDTRSTSSRSSSDANSALRMLYTSSQNTSRASSVVSNATSDNSLNTVHPSPTLHKGSSFRHQIPPPPPPPPPLLHRHHRPQLTQSQPSRPPATQQVPLPSRPTDAPSADVVANKPNTSSQPATSHRTPIYSSSPVTRSNCRYHKISIPKSEDGPRVFFLVPGCSLGNSELIEEEEILDHGDALLEDGRWMTHDLDAYEFDPCLISTLRLLVGVDLLREQEVYYLPRLGPDLVPLRRRNEGSDKATLVKASSRDQISAADHAGLIAVSPRRNSAASAISPSSSMTGSTSTSASAVRSVGRSEMKHSSVISYSESELTEDEDSPRAKRLRPSPVESRSTMGNMGPPDTQPERSRRSNGSKQGIKRSRTSDIAPKSDMDAQRSKKQKTGSIDLRGMT